MFLFFYRNLLKLANSKVINPGLNDFCRKEYIQIRVSRTRFKKHTHAHTHSHTRPFRLQLGQNDCISNFNGGAYQHVWATDVISESRCVRARAHHHVPSPKIFASGNKSASVPARLLAAAAWRTHRIAASQYARQSEFVYLNDLLDCNILTAICACACALAQLYDDVRCRCWHDARKHAHTRARLRSRAMRTAGAFVNNTYVHLK